jgi:hypothetical protein
MDIKERLALFISEKKKIFTIRVDVRDARKALDALKDERNIKWKALATDHYVFPDEEELDAALDLFKRWKIKSVEVDIT